MARAGAGDHAGAGLQPATEFCILTPLESGRVGVALPPRKQGSHAMIRPFAAAMIAIAALGAPSAVFAQDQSAVRDLFKPGAQIFGNDGKVLGKVKSIATDSFVLDSPAGPVTVPRNWVSLGSTGLFVDKATPDIAKMAKVQAKK